MNLIQMFVEVPDPLKLLIAAFVTVVVTQILKYLSGLLKMDLSGYTAQVASAIVASVVVLIDAVLTKVPAGYESIVSAFLVLLASWGGYKAYKIVRSKFPVG